MINGYEHAESERLYEEDFPYVSFVPMPHFNMVYEDIVINR